MRSIQEVLPSSERDEIAVANVPERFAELRASLAAPATY
jgi:hypothetical protein